jgi:hypothetical protein
MFRFPERPGAAEPGFAFIAGASCPERIEPVVIGSR